MPLSEDEQKRKSETTAPIENRAATGSESKSASFKDRMVIDNIDNDDELQQRREHPKPPPGRIVDPWERGGIRVRPPKEDMPPGGFGDPLDDHRPEPPGPDDKPKRPRGKSGDPVED